MSTIERIGLYYILPIISAFGVALILHFLSVHIAERLIPIGRFTSRRHRSPAQQIARHQTVVSLVSGMVSVLAFLVASFVTLAQFIDVDTLIWMIGLFGAGLGFSAKPFISDYMTGIAFITEDSFDIGEKVEVLGNEGVVEAVTLRMTTLRGNNGEVFTIPNGEIRTVRNFSRGRYSPVRVTVRVNSGDLSKALPLLKALAEEAVETLPALLEPWQVFTDEGVVGGHTDLLLVAKAKFGEGAAVRPHVLSLIQGSLSAEGVQLVD